MDKPKIVLSSIDAERLEALVDAADGGGAGLFDEIRRAEVVDPKNMPSDVVTMNSQVRVLIESTGVELDLTLVYPKDVDASGHTVSVMAPVGSALLGLAVGDSMEWSGPRGQAIKVRALELMYQPERSGDFHL